MWVPGVVVQVRGLVSYTIELGNGKQKRRHVDYLRPRVETVEEQKPDWADAVPSGPIEPAAPQPSIDESGGNDTVAASPTLRH